MRRPIAAGMIAPVRARKRAAAAHALLVRGAAGAAAPLAQRLPATALGRLERAWAGALRRALGLRLHVDGLEHVDPGQQYVVAALHESALDPIVVNRLPLPLQWVLRDEITEWPDVGAYLRASPHVVLRPEDGPAALRRLLRGGRRAFAAGASLAIFPQGTLLGIETAFARGAAVAAERLDRPLLPVVLTGTHRVWEYPFSPLLRFGQPVAMQVLPPVPASQAGRRWADVEAAMKRHALSGRVPAPRRFDPDRDGWWDGYRYEIDPDFPALAARVAAHRAQVAA